jgi:hypothetical protein
MLDIEEELIRQMLLLKELYGLEAIKAGIDARGSGFASLARMRRLTRVAGVGLFLELSRAEAVGEIEEARELGVDGLVVPMVESALGLERFLRARGRVYGERRIRLGISIETRSAIAQLGAILDLAARAVDFVTLGRKDLCSSYQDESAEQDWELADGLVLSVGGAARMRGLAFSVGGGLCSGAVERYGAMSEAASMLDFMETQAVVLRAASMLEETEARDEALRFDELYAALVGEGQRGRAKSVA